MEKEQVNKVAQLKENDNPIGNEEEEIGDGGGDEMPDMDKLFCEVVQIIENENPEQNEEEVVGVVEGDRVELSDMDKLPSEILTKIFDYLDEKQLVKCRLLSSRWNEICCLLLQDKSRNDPDSNLIVQLEGNMECKIVIKKSLADFIDCFAPSEVEKSLSSGSGSARLRPFPFSCFNFDSLQNMDVAQICKFVSTFGPHMKSVFVDNGSEGMTNFEKLWRHLLLFAPNVQLLGLKGHFSLKNVTLADLRNDTFLKNLKVLGISPKNCGPLGFVKDLLKSTPNVKEGFSSRLLTGWKCDELQGLEVWQQLNKAHLLKTLGTEWCSRSNLSPVDLMKNLQLEHLTANCCVPFNSDPKSEKSSLNYVYHALKSTGETLTSLFLCYLSVESMNYCLKNIRPFPNVRQLNIVIMGGSDKGIVLERCIQLCPNTTNLNLGCLLGDFSQVVPILWTGFQGLKSLEFEVDMPTEFKNDSFAPNLDSGISGYSQESIQKIQTKLEEGISLEEARRGEPQSPSILDLKDLSRFELKFFMGHRNDEMKNVENQLRKSFFLKMLPQHIRENPRSVTYGYFNTPQ